MKKITEYFRNTLAASSQGTHEYKDNGFCTISREELESGWISGETEKFLWKSECMEDIDAEEEPKDNVKSIIIALKTIATEYEEGEKKENNIEEMLSFFFLPANVDRSGKLFFPDEGKLPWVPREYMRPMEDAQIAVGDSDKYDKYLEMTTDARNQIDSWNKYLEYAKKMYEYITDTDFDEQNFIIDNETIRLDAKYYLFIDTMVIASGNVIQLYNDLLKNDENKLYRKLTNGETEPSKPLILNTNINKMKQHVGQMGGEYALSPSQREAVNHFTEIIDGDILAVSGPPGTGKTTLLQSVVADMYVEAALKKSEAPIIVASSTNNKAVTNIIETFGNINVLGIANIEKKWVKGTNSFATYFPSKGKMKEAEEKDYQYTTVCGQAFFDALESEENREKSRENFQLEYSNYMGEAETDFDICKDKMWKRLNDLDQKRIRCLDHIEEIKNVIGTDSCESYVSKQRNYLNEGIKQRDNLSNEIIELKNKNVECIGRHKSWREAYEQLPWYIRFLKFIPYFNKKISEWVFCFFENEEAEFLRRDMNIEEIETVYRSKIIENDNELIKLKNNVDLIEIEIKRITQMIDDIEKKIFVFKSMLHEFEKYNIDLMSEKEEGICSRFDVCELNDLLDRVRYVEFWLAVHYYECRWLLEKNPITEKQKGKTFESVLNIMYHRLAMISPCMVMTFYMLPKQFQAYDSNDKVKYYMYDYIDLLIVDEAGQISPEIAAPSFALAKKAVVVGDEFQIPPVWGTTKALDIAMAVSKGVIENKDQYHILEENGLNCAQSSVMKVAALSCAFDKYSKGLFLCEHRRCYNEIIEYCNKLVYGGKLEPKRGSFIDDRKNAIRGTFPVMGHKQITVDKSQKTGTSRRNSEEARQIVDWLKYNYSIIEQCYNENSENAINKKELIGIITPFKSQSILIKQIIKKEIPEYEKIIEVGTVHTFQGAERKVIIFSSVYGNKDGCFFINKASNLMNVAVSRAKDSFLVFGDSGCLIGDKTAAGLLKSAIQANVL